jgi:hypothetical protein
MSSGSETDPESESSSSEKDDSNLLEHINLALCEAVTREMYDKTSVSVRTCGQLIIHKPYPSSCELSKIREYLLNYPCDLTIDYVFPEGLSEESVARVNEFCEVIREIRRVRPGFRLELAATCEDHTEIDDNELISQFQAGGECSQLAELANSIHLGPMYTYEFMQAGLHRNAGTCTLTPYSILRHDYAPYITSDMRELELEFLEKEIYKENFPTFIARLEQILFIFICNGIESISFRIGLYLNPLLDTFLERAASLKKLEIHVTGADAQDQPTMLHAINRRLWDTIPTLEVGTKERRPIQLDISDVLHIPPSTLHILYTKFDVVSSNIFKAGHELESLCITHSPHEILGALSDQSLVYLRLDIPLDAIDLFKAAFVRLKKLRRCVLKLLTEYGSAAQPPDPEDIDKLCSGIMANSNIEELGLTILHIPFPVHYSKYTGRLFSEEHPNLRKLAMTMGYFSHISGRPSRTNTQILTYLTELLDMNVNIDGLYTRIFLGTMSIRNSTECDALIQLLQHTGRLRFLGCAFSVDQLPGCIIDQLLEAVMSNRVLLPIKISFPSCYVIPDSYVKYVFERMSAYRFEICAAQILSMRHYVRGSLIFDPELTRLLLRFAM